MTRVMCRITKQLHVVLYHNHLVQVAGFGCMLDLCDNGISNMHAMVAVDLTQGQAPLPSGEPPVPGNHDLAATLKALAANSHSFGGSSAAQSANLSLDGIDPEMITRLGRCPKHPTAVDCIAPLLMQPDFFAACYFACRFA